MSVPVASARGDLVVTGTVTRGGRTVAAKRAYDKRQQRARSHTGSAPTSGKNGIALATRIPFVALIIGLLSVGLAVTLLLTTRSAEDSYQLSAAKAVNQTLVERAAALERDVETANSAPELAKRAKELGMIPTKDVPRLLVAPDGGVQVIGTPTPAQGAPAPDFDAAQPNTLVSGSATPTTVSGATSREALTPLVGSVPNSRQSDRSAQPAAPTTQQAAPTAQPAAPVAQPAAPVAQPVAPVAQPAAPAAQPVAPAAPVGEQLVAVDAPAAGAL